MPDEIARHAAQVPGQVAQVAMAGALRRMHHRGLRAKRDPAPRTPQADAQIDILVIKEVFLVEAAQRRIVHRREQHEHAGHPVGVEGRVVPAVAIAAVGQAQQLGEQAQQAGKAPRAVLDRAIRARHRRGAQGGAFPQAAEQRRKGIPVEAHIRIQDAVIRRVGVREGRIVVGAEALRRRVAQHDGAAGQRGRNHRLLLGHVDRQDHARHFRTAGQVAQQRIDHAAVAVADDGHRNQGRPPAAGSTASR